MKQLEDNLHYRFKDNALLHRALCHRSFVNEQGDAALRDNERLEFLGDAVVNLAVGHILMAHDQDLKEGDLSRIRASLVNETQLAEFSRILHLGRFLQLGKGEDKTGGREKNSILADTFEAALGAVYLDGGFDAALAIMHRFIMPQLEKADRPDVSFDYKSRLQEIVQKHQDRLPRYRVVEETGPDHAKTFVVELTVADLCIQGHGQSIKLAEQSAARKAMERLAFERQEPGPP
jgi:ribonuclease III